MKRITQKQLDFILQQGEGYNIEFKEGFDKSLAKEVVAFANANGGRVFLGVDDSSKVKGINITNRLKSQIQDLANNCDPSIKINFLEFEKVLVIEVKEGTEKPYKCKEGFFVRIGPNSQKMSREMIINMAVKVGKVKFDEQVNEKFNFKQDFDEQKFKSFLLEAKMSSVISIKNSLLNLSLAVKDKNKFLLNNAGILLFAKEPYKFFKQNFITCVLYKGKERVDVIDRKDFNNDLFSNYNDGINFLIQHLKLKYVIKGTGPRKEILELPEEALRESLLNAIIHRDYFDSRVGIFVEIFDDRVEIVNKGNLLFDRKDLGKISFPRNPLIFDVFHHIGLIEKIGSGINRIKKYVKERDLKVKFDIGDFFRITFVRDLSEKLGEKWSDKWSDKWSERQIKILEIIKENPKISRKELADKIGINQSAIQKHLEKFKKKGLLKRIGAAKGGYWKVETR